MAGLTIGRVAGRTGVTTDTIRYYERRGLLSAPARTPSGYRQYPDTVVNRIALVRNAQRFGFSLAEIASFLRVRERGGHPCQAVRAAAGRMLTAVDRQIQELTATRERMRETLKDWDHKLARARGGPAQLLEALNLTAESSRPARKTPVKHRT
jgi:MerR family transcriptional regulator, copper efflux regulator